MPAGFASSVVDDPSLMQIPDSIKWALGSCSHSTAVASLLPRAYGGVLLAQGPAAGGFTLYVKDRRLHYLHNWVGRELLQLTADAKVSAGRHELRYEFEPTGRPDLAQGHRCPGRFQLYIDGDLSDDWGSPTQRRSRSTPVR